jgi:hypothetical protein
MGLPPSRARSSTPGPTVFPRSWLRGGRADGSRVCLGARDNIQLGGLHGDLAMSGRDARAVTDLDTLHGPVGTEV